MTAKDSSVFAYATVSSLCEPHRRGNGQCSSRITDQAPRALDCAALPVAPHCVNCRPHHARCMTLHLLDLICNLRIAPNLAAQLIQGCRLQDEGLERFHRLFGIKTHRDNRMHQVYACGELGLELHLAKPPVELPHGCCVSIRNKGGRS